MQVSNGPSVSALAVHCEYKAQYHHHYRIRVKGKGHFKMPDARYQIEGYGSVLDKVNNNRRLDPTPHGQLDHINPLKPNNSI